MKIKLMMSVSIVIGFYLSFGTFANNSTALAQESTNNTKNINPSIVYAETARNLLYQLNTKRETSVELKNLQQGHILITLNTLKHH